MKKLVLVLTLLGLVGFLLTGCSKKKRYYNTTVSDSTQVEENTTNVTNINGSLKKLLHRLDEISKRLDSLEATAHVKVDLSGLNSSVSSITSRLAYLETNVGGIKKDGNNLVIEGCNLVVRDASSGPKVDGVGNILVGRDATDKYTSFYGTPPLRTGSNNIVVGGANEYTGEGGLCVGILNKLLGDSGVVFACENVSKNLFSTVTGGTNNKACGKFSSISGGKNRSVSGSFDWRGGFLFSPN